MEDNKKYGRCTNYGSCDDANNKTVQEVEDGKAFECPTCGSQLKETDASGKLKTQASAASKKKRNKIIAIICGCVLIGLIIAAIIVFVPRGNKENVEPQPVEEAMEIPAVEEPDTVAEEPVVAEPEPVQEVKNTPQPAQKPEKAAPQVHKLNYGTWTGGWKNGQPDGNGTMTYTTEHRIDERDSKARVAQPGEYIVGEWDNGRLVQGRWFKKDGSKEAVIIGKAG